MHRSSVGNVHARSLDTFITDASQCGTTFGPQHSNCRGPRWVCLATVAGHANRVTAHSQGTVVTQFENPGNSMQKGVVRKENSRGAVTCGFPGAPGGPLCATGHSVAGHISSHTWLKSGLVVDNGTTVHDVLCIHSLVQ